MQHTCRQGQDAALLGFEMRTFGACFCVNKDINLGKGTFLGRSAAPTESHLSKVSGLAHLKSYLLKIREKIRLL